MSRRNMRETVADRESEWARELTKSTHKHTDTHTHTHTHIHIDYGMIRWSLLRVAESWPDQTRPEVGQKEDTDFVDYL